MRRYIIILCGTIVPVAVFCLSLLLVITIDRSLRLIDGNIRTGGMPETVWFASHGLCALLPAVLMVCALRNLKSLWGRITLAIITIVSSLILYIFIVLHYITSSGIDSL
jgi:hypothetical protein